MKFKSASCQIAFWEGGELRVTNYLTRRQFSTEPITLELIRFFFTPRSIEEAICYFTYDSRSVANLILQLVEAQLLLEYKSRALERDEMVRKSWGPWLPECSFHFMTKDTPFLSRELPLEERLKRLPTTPTPSLFKEMRTSNAIRLPAIRQNHRDVFFKVLHTRRTHRTFGTDSVPLEQICELLQTTWGVQGYIQTNVFGKLPYKTSPSGGARHPVEVYLMALKVEGLERGVYYYHPRANRLAKITGRATPSIASAYCADQSYYAKAAALFIMTAVFGRTMWKYGKAHAYRAVLLEAGHLCQTFCLTATRLELAPFSTAAMRDTLIENDLKLDGINESVLYIAGVGQPVDQTPKKPDRSCN